LTGHPATSIVYQMFRRVRSKADRATALSATFALIVVVFASTGAFAAAPDASGEPCLGCSGCDSGECGGGDGDPLTTHHHCCTTCCLSHAPIALSTTHSAPAPMIVGSMVRVVSVAVASRAPETPYRPPRV